eukprot:CAMPEP_0119113012 /NCGR_PEP_ID=MMETSP1180-20130426/42458_1 /TAXON_ID=3052 ORGANISM="Chlamydomonas cf sp, Strain CCMP681" /NCGR_SAMPLE_ID=MMETSP1180 /ASSEMBLY_ACC=CAM_ASM_000741 /LENGTH=40 /DNA_ID= /DNA_START= /DNA_END= /DNA_ORIENTATION=
MAKELDVDLLTHRVWAWLDATWAGPPLPLPSDLQLEEQRR